MKQAFSNIARLWQGICPICSDRAKFLFKFFLKRLKPFCKTPVQNYKTDMIINKIAGNRNGWIKERKNLTNPVKKGFPQCESGKTAVIHLFHWFQPNKGFSLSTFSRKMEKSFGYIMWKHRIQGDETMRFSINQSELLNALSIVQKGVSARSTLPVLAGIYVEAIGDQVTFQTTNLELSIQYTSTALVEEEGRAVFPGKLIVDIVKNLPDAAVHIEANEMDSVVTCESSSFSIKCLNPADFPGFPKVDAESHGFVSLNAMFSHYIAKRFFHFSWKCWKRKTFVRLKSVEKVDNCRFTWFTLWKSLFQGICQVLSFFNSPIAITCDFINYHISLIILNWDFVKRFWSLQKKFKENFCLPEANGTNPLSETSVTWKHRFVNFVHNGFQHFSALSR